MSTEEIWKSQIESAIRQIEKELKTIREGLAQDLSRVLAALSRIEQAVGSR